MDSAPETTATTGTTQTDDPIIQVISTVNAEGISAVYASGFVLTLACWAIGAKIGIAVQAIRKA